MSVRSIIISFSDLELIMATRVSLLHSARQKEERQQIGTLVTPLAHGLREIEKRCLVRLSLAARNDNHVQIALNSIMRAQQLCKEPSIDVAEEYASVLWEQKEQGAAIQYLQSIIQPLDQMQERDAQQVIYHALLKARLVSLSFNLGGIGLISFQGSWIATACLESPTAIWESYLQKAVKGLETNIVIDVESSKSRAIVYHDCALFAERQYYLTLKSPDGIRFKVYVDRKTQEVQHWNTQLASAGDPQSREDFHKQRFKAKKILQQDSEQFRKHVAARDQFLEQALEMYSKSLEVADTYNDDASIRFCSLWFSNFESEGDLQNTIDTALSRIPSYKMVFLAVGLLQLLQIPMTERSLASAHCQTFLAHRRTTSMPAKPAKNDIAYV
jgi:ataxia telangiectasia mutated family protein